MLKQGAGQIPQLAEQLGVNILSLRVFGPDHIILADVDSDDIDSVLLRYALERCDRDGLTAYLEATSPLNRPLYERHGFEELGMIQGR